mmetsp:Transcript_10780/g.22130  ORF Transcript_10780/g.22130 Transcript_10780/m.22130 type:complete len:1377 (+) Transcript_10780:38-4168(+)|eukprot:CAMPEP_0118637108 /NCGR_PEP_ID=MMETSP0785-20121206/2979_1 /TAXON_ID=91992 /ORGANISM="Bolidomonas pacifica, Strain CCMP 1866" /LENGTH=1376 /DNA_ID=CAMNT_0006528277 /DNA_START=1 /DNA_END=4131 /DNA_ORIENTATION=-
MIEKALLVPEVEQLLSHLPSLDDDVPKVQLNTAALDFETGAPAQFSLSHDKRMPGTTYDTDLKIYQDAELFVEHGFHFCNMLYAFRSISRAIPTIKDISAEAKSTINHRTYEILGPEMRKLIDLRAFCSNTSTFFCEVLERLASPDAMSTSMVREEFCDVLIQLTDVLQKIDNLKDMKACLKNDFSLYKRCFTLIRTELQASDIVQEEVQQLQMFLANPGYSSHIIMSQLRERVKQITNHEDVLLEMILLCCSKIEKGMHVSCSDKYCLHRALPYLVYFIDSEGKKAFNAFRARKMPLLRVQKIIKNLPVVPEVADMTINLATIISMCPNYNADKMAASWGTGKPLPVIVDHYNLTTHWKKIREQHTVYATKFSRVANDDSLDQTLRGLNSGTSSKKQVTLTPNEILHETGKIYKLAKEGLHLMKSWTCYILEMSAWKFQHPADDATMKKRGWEPNTELTGNQQQAVFFEKVVRYNYSKEELSVLVDCISMIKSLAFLLKEKEHKLAPILRVYMQTYIQNFVNSDLAPLVKKSDSKGRPILSFLHNIQGLVEDYVVSSGSSSKSFKKAMKESKNADGRKFTTRLVGPGSTQLHLLRVMLRSMNDGAGRGHYLKDIDKSTMKLLSAFHEHTYFFPHLTVLGSTIGACSNLGDLWYRELYIQMTNCTQFPIEMSLPFLLSESVVSSTENIRVPVLENVVSALDVYNDAATYAIQVLQLQHLYDEIEAEVNLVFDQMMFLIGEQMYDHFKNAASSSLLNGTYKDAIEKVKGYKQLTVQEKRFAPPATQRHVLLLGRSIDLNYLISTHVNHKLAKDIEAILKRFESGDLSVVIETEKMLEVVKMTHHRLSKVLELDSYDIIFNSSNADVNAKHMSGRLLRHLKTTILEDLAGNYSYNVYTQRFVHSPIIFKQTGREKDPKPPPGIFGFGTVCGRAWDFLQRLSRGFVGRAHIDALVRLAGEAGVVAIIESCMTHIEEKMRDMMPYLKQLKEGLPPITLPKVVYGTVACFGAFETRLKQYFSYMDFLDESFQGFREMGNIVGLVTLLEASLATQQANNYVNAASFLGVKCNVKSEYSGFVDSARGRTQSGVGEDRRIVVKGIQMPRKENFVCSEPRLSPLHNCMENFVTESAGAVERIRATKVRDDIVPMLEKTHLSYEHLSFSQSEVKIGDGILQRIEKAVDKVGIKEALEFDSGVDSIVCNDRNDEFYRIFSVLNFLLCMEHKGRVDEDQMILRDGINLADDTTFSDPHVFGHGFAIGGVVCLHLFKQSFKFKLLDLTYHMLNVEDAEKIRNVKNMVEGKAALPKDPVVEKFLAEARAQSEIHEYVWGLLEGCRGKEKKEDNEERATYTFFPPNDDRNISAMPSNMRRLLHKNSSSINE